MQVYLALILFSEVELLGKKELENFKTEQRMLDCMNIQIIDYFDFKFLNIQKIKLKQLCIVYDFYNKVKIIRGVFSIRRNINL